MKRKLETLRSSKFASFKTSNISNNDNTVDAPQKSYRFHNGSTGFLLDGLPTSNGTGGGDVLHINTPFGGIPIGLGGSNERDWEGSVVIDGNKFLLKNHRW